MNKSKIALIFFFVSSYCLSQTSLSQKIDSLLSDKFFESTTVSVDIFDLTTQTELYQRNKKLLITPASNMKILTSAAGLLFLGPDYNFTSSVFYTGEIDDDEIEGDLYFAGGCDPEFKTEDLRTLIRQIKRLRINEIDGNIYGDISMMDSLYWGKGWMWDDDPSPSVPYLTPLTINDASIKIIFSPCEIGKPAMIKLLPDPGYITIENNSTTVSSDSSNINVTRNWYSNIDEIIVNGQISINEQTDTVEVNLTDPARYFMALISSIFNEEEIEFDGEIYFGNTPVDAGMLSSFIRPYHKIITGLNKDSDNLNAEMTLRALAVKHFSKPATAKNGLKMLDSLITICGFNPANYKLADGSGLSRYNLISTGLILGTLKYIYSTHPKLYRILHDSFSIAGIDGTLKKRMINTACTGNVYAKTGTMAGVSVLSGYLSTRTNHNVAFSIAIENFTGDSKTACYFQDEICKILCEAEIN